MNNNNVNMLQNILEALMSISTKGNDTITMSNILQALNDVIKNMEQEGAKPSITVEEE